LPFHSFPASLDRVKGVQCRAGHYLLVRTVRKATEREVLACFWNAELAAPWRWAPADVAERRRQWRERDGLFGGFPDDVEWERAALTPDEVLEILYINWDWWLKVSNGTRLPRLAAEGDRAVAAAVATNPELIVVTTPERSKLVVLEGHIRVSSYADYPEYLPDELELYLGVSPRMAEWSNF
jgi:hypothetical protein